MILIVYVQQQKMMKQIQVITKVSHYFSLCLTKLTNHILKGLNEECLHINSYANVVFFNDNNNKYS